MPRQAKFVTYVEPPVLLMACSDGEIDEASYSAYLNEFVRRRASIRAFLVYTNGARFDARQRARTVDACGSQSVNFALMTDSVMARAAITAFSWMLPQRVRAFDTASLQKALDYLDISASQRGELTRRFGQMVSSVGGRLTKDSLVEQSG